jgi:hypothetical protein
MNYRQLPFGFLRLSGLLVWYLLLPAASGFSQIQDDHTATSAGPAAPTVAEAAAAMKKAATYFRQNVVTEGGYPKKAPSNSEEAEATETPGNLDRAAPIGIAYILAYQATGDPYYLDVPREAAHALARNQLASGGWHHKMNSDPERAKTFYYRRDLEAGQKDAGERINITVFDDDVSQSAARLLMLYDRATGFEDAEVHHASLYALSGFMNLQYSSGGWPMWVETSKQVPTVKAHYPGTWSKTWPKDFYPPLYTINDAAIPGVIDALLLAHAVYGDREYLESACLGGDFLILAQMPAPQPAWAQQYNMEMTPAWARRFEPPSIVSRESVDVIKTLMKMYVVTGEEKYRAPLGPALDWLERSRLPDGQYARFYELKTNRPIFFTTNYELVYTDDDLPTHYQFKLDIDLGSLRWRYDGLDKARRAYAETGTTDELRLRRLLDWPGRQATPKAAREVIDAMDDQGRWLDGRNLSRTFVENMTLLSSYVASHQ